LPALRFTAIPSRFFKIAQIRLYPKVGYFWINCLILSVSLGFTAGNTRKSALFLFLPGWQTHRETASTSQILRSEASGIASLTRWASSRRKG
jgi:hypothetical protein